MKFLPFILLLLCQFSVGQIVPTVLTVELPLEADVFVGVDDYANIYFIKNNVLHKKGKKETYQYVDLQLGELSSVDILNPLKITLFYKDMNTVVFLDRHLIEIDRLRFNFLPNFRTVDFATTASNNNLWIMNVDSQSLEIYNYQQQEMVASSQPIASEIIDHESNFNFCWLLLKNSLERYNTYGTLVSRMAEVSLEAISENNGRLIGKTKEGFVFLEKNSTKFMPLNLAAENVRQFFLNDDKLYIFDGKLINAYQLNLTK